MNRARHQRHASSNTQDGAQNQPRGLDRLLLQSVPLRHYIDNYDSVSAAWVFQEDWNPAHHGYVFMDGAVTLGIQNGCDVSCYVLHEAGHGRFLHHHITSGGSGNASDNPGHHDADQVRCTMSYMIDGISGAAWKYPFCGKCLLKLRGVDISALPNQYKNI